MFMHHVILFLAGAFLCNAVPHLVAGLLGQPFPTPFGKPRGVGMSPPLVNFLWGVFNLCVGLFRLARHPVTLGANLDCLAIALGALAIGIHLSRHFGKVRQDAAGAA